MNRRNRAKLHMLDGLDPEVAMRVGEKRAVLLAKAHRRRRVRWISVSSVAASLVILLSATVMLWGRLGGTPMVDTPTVEKKIPIYEGMTIESAETVGSLLAMTDAPILTLNNDHNNGVGNAWGNSSVKGDKYNPSRDGEIDQDAPFGEENAILDAVEDRLSIVGADRDMYYANPNEDIYFVIHINNPDAFEILSFTINGTKYSSYMFEAGSDLETLILKYNVGDVEGVVEYTIDAIKYVDGSEIKDVRMEGDRTVKAGVYSEDKQPTPTLTEERITFHNVSFRVSVTDQLNLIGGSKGKLLAVLYDGETILKQTELTVGVDNTVTFDGLHSGKLYEYAVIGVYDSFDGNGVSAHTLTSKAFYTKDVVLFDNVNVTDNRVTYSLKWGEDVASKTLKSLTLMQGESKTELAVGTTEIALLSDLEYTLTATYETNGTTEEISISFRTVARVQPTASLGEITTTADGISFILNETDESNIGAVSTVELFDGDELVKSVTGDVREVSDVASGVYTVKITYLYDMNDGAGEQMITVTDDVFVESHGLEITDGVIVGIGTCTDSVLYLNHPIAASAFYNREDLLSVTLWEGVTSIGDDAFSSRTPKIIEVINHSSLAIAAGSDDYGSIAEYAKEVHSGESKIVNVNDYLFYTYNNGNYLFGYVGSDTEMTLPANYNGQNYEIYQYAFYNRDDLTSVTIPNSVTSIGMGAFRKCASLETVVIPSSVTEIGGDVFSWCTSLESITIPSGVTSLGVAAFYECSSLTSITLPSGITSIGSNAFQGCTSLEEMIISSSVTFIGSNTFNGCTSLEKIIIPSEVTFIGYRAFAGCNGLTSVTFENTEGWYSQWSSTTTNLSSSSLASTSTAATYLTSTYADFNWNRD